MSYDSRVEAVARALCKLDGKDPDQKAAGQGSIILSKAVLGQHDDPLPRWHEYAEAARRHVAAFDVLSELGPREPQ